MHARDENRPYLIAARMKRWLEIVRTPLLDLRCPAWKARRNYLKLVRRYPEIATALGYTEALSSPRRSTASGLPSSSPSRRFPLTSLIRRASRKSAGR